MMVPVRLLSGARHPQAASVQRPKGARSRAAEARPSLSCPGVGAGRADNWQCGLLGCAAADPPGQLTSAGAARRFNRPRLPLLSEWGARWLAALPQSAQDVAAMKGSISRGHGLCGQQAKLATAC